MIVRGYYGFMLVVCVIVHLSYVHTPVCCKSVLFLDDNMSTVQPVLSKRLRGYQIVSA